MDPKTALTVVAVAAIASAFAACSAGSSDTTGLGGSSTGATSGSGAGSGAGSGTGNGLGGASNVGGDTGILPNLGGTAGVDPGTGLGGGSCGTVQKPEEIIVYSPVGLFIMQDRSGSMVTGIPAPASPDGWNNSLAAVTAFVNDPSSSGLSVGLGAFPPMVGNVDCAGGSDCGTPIVPIAELPANSAPMISGMQTATPSNPFALTPTECGLRGMVAECQRYTAATGVQCVGVLVTDGTPTLCDGNAANLANILAGASAQGMKTFAIGLPGSNLPALDQLAQAGGTNAAIDVSGGASAFIAALNSIRGKVSVGTALQCQWTIPPPASGETFNPKKVNVAFAPAGGASRDFGYVDETGCAGVTDAWHFDDPIDPKQVLVCPTTCDMLKASTGAQVTVSFGCNTKPAIPK